MKPMDLVKFLDNPLVASLLTVAGLMASAEIVSALSPHLAPIIFMCVGAGGAAAILFGKRLKHIAKHLNCI